MTAEESPSTSVLIELLKQGDPDAQTMLFRRMYDRLVALARKKLGAAPRREMDEEDVAASVFRSLCEAAAQGRFEQLSDSEDLWRLLLAMTRRKAIDMIRRQTRQKRGNGTVRGESVFVSDSQSERSGLDQAATDRTSPSLDAEFEEHYTTLLDRLKDDTQRRVVTWKLEGYTNQEIANSLGVTTRSVERKLNLIRQQWSQSEETSEGE